MSKTDKDKSNEGSPNPTDPCTKGHNLVTDTVVATSGPNKGNLVNGKSCTRCPYKEGS